MACLWANYTSHPVAPGRWMVPWKWSRLDTNPGWWQNGRNWHPLTHATPVAWNLKYCLSRFEQVQWQRMNDLGSSLFVQKPPRVDIVIANTRKCTYFDDFWGKKKDIPTDMFCSYLFIALHCCEFLSPTCTALMSVSAKCEMNSKVTPNPIPIKAAVVTMGLSDPY